MTSTRVDVVHVEAATGISDAAAEYAQAKVATAMRVAGEPIPYVRVRLSELANPSIEQRAVAEANVDYNGRLIRVQAAAPTLREAIDALEPRLRARMERVTRHWEAIRGSVPKDVPGEWRHSSARADRPPYFPRPSEERQLVRRKSYALAHLTIDEAALEMDLLDYDFHLFIDAESGDPSVLSRAGDTLRLARLRRHHDRKPSTSLPVAVWHHAAPRLTLDEAIERLDVTSDPFVFYRDVDDGQAQVLYRRYDGHYGLITPQR